MKDSIKQTDNTKRKRRRILAIILLLVLLGAGGFGGYYTYTYRSDIVLSPELDGLQQSVSHEAISCKDISQGALGTVNLGLLNTCGEQTPYPLASMTKVLTALVVVNDFSDKLQEKIALDSGDVELYRQEVARNGSNIKVEAPGEYSIQQMLEGMIVASSNNFADSLVTHLYGDTGSYFARARVFLEDNALQSVEIGGDASGFDPQNKASAKDMFQIGVLGMKSAVVKQILALKTVELPVYVSRGTFTETERSTTYMHFSNPEAYLGIKSGTSDEAGRNLTFAARFDAFLNTPPDRSPPAEGSASSESEASTENEDDTQNTNNTEASPTPEATPEDPQNEDILVGVMMGGGDDYNYHQVLDYTKSAEALTKPIRLLEAGQHLGSAKVKTAFGEQNFNIAAASSFEALLPKTTTLKYELEVWRVENDQYAGRLHIFTSGEADAQEIGSIPCNVSMR